MKSYNLHNVFIHDNEDTGHNHSKFGVINIYMIFLCELNYSLSFMNCLQTLLLCKNKQMLLMFYINKELL